MNQYFIIHGSLGKPFENWFPWAYEELTKQGKRVYVPSFPTQEDQNKQNWTKVLEGYWKAGLINENTVFIAHSLAPIFICGFILEHNIKVKGIICVSGFNTLLDLPLDEINKTFFIDHKELEKVRNLVDSMYCFYSDNDPYIPQEELEKFATIIHAQKRFVSGAGHFNAPAGYTNFPALLEVVEEIK